jgi:hypothetical protein
MRRGKCRSDKRKMIEEKLKAPPSNTEDGPPVLNNAESGRRWYLHRHLLRIKLNYPS